MAKISDSQPLLPSVLDRLIDLEPGVSREVPKSRAQVLRELKQSVRRDLENLLNTRRRCKEISADYEELRTSLATYGIPDFAGVRSSTTTFRDRIHDWIDDAIRRFEPRIKTALVEMVDSGDGLTPTLRFRIDALLHAEPAPEPVTFDSTLEAATGVVTIEQAKL